jgi:predicted nuclease of predicted toxin-antitoxin system
MKILLDENLDWRLSRSLLPKLRPGRVVVIE